MPVTELKRVVYVDDEPDIRAVVDLALGDVAGFNVTLCASGHEALEVVPRVRPQLVLLDVMMPGLDGPSTLQRLRADPSVADIPVIFMTAKIQPQEVARFREAGAIAVIGKPFDPMTLGDRVKAIWAESGG